MIIFGLMLYHNFMRLLNSCRGFLLVIFFIYGCSESTSHKNKKAGVSGSQRIQNLTIQTSFPDNIIEVPLDSAFVKGIAIPSHQDHINITFDLLNPGGKPVEYFYKILYQNESYKHAEYLTSVAQQKTINLRANQNFYGSWPDPGIGFKPVGELKAGQSISIRDSIRVLGNPLNLEKYFGKDLTPVSFTQEAYAGAIDFIRNSPEWFAQVKLKAKKLDIPVDEQLKKDATWALQQKQDKGLVNNRWKLNPRMGDYSLLIVLTTRESLNNIPEYAIDISKSGTDNQRVNPYYYYLHSKHGLFNLWTSLNKVAFTAKATFSGEQGLYRKEEKKNNCRGTNLSESCNSSDQLYVNAQFEPYAHAAVSGFKLNNIPLAYDVAHANYTREMYDTNSLKYKSAERVKTPVEFEECACINSCYDSIKNSIIIANQGSRGGHFRKQNAGIIGRVGFTYGKYTARIKYPEIMSEDHIWNGLTCAFWLLSHSQENWNMRSTCDSLGYIPKDQGPERLPRVSYSEIDIEILKTASYWPRTSYGPASPYPPLPGNPEDEIMVAATNWDLACADPYNYIIGAQSRLSNLGNFTHHRWDSDYKALTSKNRALHDDIMGRIYYFQIDWQPNRIIYRMGPSKDELRVFCVMDSSITTIPDNQMVPVISQEFHNSDWWDPAIFEQNNIPFPLNDLVGRVYEVTVE